MKRLVALGILAIFVLSCEHSAVAPPERPLTPDQPQFLIRGPVTQVAAGEDFSCAIGSDGLASCWGLNRDFLATPPQKVFTYLGAGTDQGCGVAADGVWCWGAYRSPGGSRMAFGSFQQVAVGNDFSCALRDDGTVACWPIRNGTAPVPPEGTFSQISAGSVHACGLHTDQTVECWTYIVGGPGEPPSGTFINVSAGRNSSVDCGVRTDHTLECWGALAGRSDDWQGLLSTVPSGSFLEVGVTKYAACALRTSGTIACWGNTVGEWATPPAGTFDHISAGETHSCAWTVDGVIKCWGSDSWNSSTGLTYRLFDQVALGGSVMCGLTYNSGGTIACIGSGLANATNPPTGFYSEVTLGFNHACALQKDASIDCWGNNLQGQTTAPSGTFIDVSAGPYYNCAVRTNQTLVCWGDLDQDRDAWPTGTFSRVSAGNNHVCALRTDHTIACWGNAADGKTTPPSGTFTQLSAGTGHNCALTPEQAIVCWGNNDHGKATPPAGTFSRVVAGLAHTCGLKTDGTVSCWGEGPESLRKPEGEFVDLFGWHSGGDNCALKWDHTIECWGDGIIQNVVASNRAPVILSSGGPYSGLEGSPVTFTATARDPDDDPLTYTWTFADGGAAIGPQVTHTFNDDRADGWHATLDVDDDHTHTASDFFTVNIANVAPVLAPLADVPPGGVQPECRVRSERMYRKVGGFTDPGQDEWTISVNWGDQSLLMLFSPSVPPSDPQSSLTGDFLLTHCFNPGTYTITVTIDDGDGGTDQLTTQFIANRPPVASAGGPYTGSEGSNIPLALGATDADGDVLAFSWDLGDGTVGTGTPPAAHAYRDNGQYTITLTATDPLGESDTKTATVTIDNVAPTATWTHPNTLDEGSSYMIALTNPVDPSALDVAAGFSYAFDCGAGAGYGAWGSATSESCATSDNGTRNARAKIRDKDGGETEYIAPIVIDNVAPALGALSAPIDPQAIGTSVTVSASYTDPGSGDTHTASIDWGDGIGSGVAQSGTASGSHVYLAAGVYTVRMTVRDDDGAVSNETVFRYIVVYDAAAGFVTGGGWFNSPAGAYVPNPAAAGKATFGFVAKYQKGKSTPDGNTEFQFRAVNLNFKSTSYDWLVVAGARGKFKGEGTINGGATIYGFMLTATDGALRGGGGPDGVRIKIWDIATGQVVYDNQAGASDDGDATTALEGGSIVIHQ